MFNVNDIIVSVTSGDAGDVTTDGGRSTIEQRLRDGARGETENHCCPSDADRPTRYTRSGWGKKKTALNVV